MEQYVIAIEEHLKEVLVHKRLPIFMLANRVSTHDTTGAMPTTVMFKGELYLPCNLLFRAPHNKEQSMTDCVVDLVFRLCDIHRFERQLLRVARDRTKAHYVCLANST